MGSQRQKNTNENTDFYSKWALFYYSSQYDDFGFQDTQVHHFAQEEIAIFITISDKCKKDK